MVRHLQIFLIEEISCKTLTKYYTLITSEGCRPLWNGSTASSLMAICMYVLLADGLFLKIQTQGMSRWSRLTCQPCEVFGHLPPTLHVWNCSVFHACTYFLIWSVLVVWRAQSKQCKLPTLSVSYGQWSVICSIYTSQQHQMGFVSAAWSN